jgi:hypothetical protein
MSRVTTITDPDGRVTTIRQRGGCGSGCAWVFWLILAVFVVAAPAEEFPLWGAVLAYALEAVLLAAAIHQWLVRHHQTAPPVAPEKR